MASEAGGVEEEMEDLTPVNPLMTSAGPSVVPAWLAKLESDGKIVREPKPVLTHHVEHRKGVNIHGRRWVNAIYSMGFVQAAVLIALAVLIILTFQDLRTLALTSLTQVMIIPGMIFALVVIPVKYKTAWETGKQAEVGRAAVGVYIAIEVVDALANFGGIIYRSFLLEVCGTAGHDDCHTDFLFRAEITYLTLQCVGFLVAVMGFVFGVLLYLRLGYGRSRTQLSYVYYFVDPATKARDHSQHPIYVPATGSQRAFNHRGEELLAGGQLASAVAATVGHPAPLQAAAAGLRQRGSGSVASWMAPGRQQQQETTSFAAASPSSQQQQQQHLAPALPVTTLEAAEGKVCCDRPTVETFSIPSSSLPSAASFQPSAAPARNSSGAASSSSSKGILKF